MGEGMGWDRSGLCRSGLQKKAPKNRAPEIVQITEDVTEPAADARARAMPAAWGRDLVPVRGQDEQCNMRHCKAKAVGL